MLKKGTYIATAYEDLELPDRPEVKWKDGYMYEAIVDETGTMFLSSESIYTYYTPDAVERMKAVFNFEEY